MRLKKISALLIGLLSAVLLSIILDIGLGLIGLPAEPTQIAHPPNFSETRQNIEFTYTFQTNSQGIRYPEIPLEKPPSNDRIVVLGDSFTEGWGVEYGDIFSARLEKSFSTPDKPVEFINCGLSGTAPLQYARIFFVVCIDYQPDAVLIVLYPNDIIGTPLQAVPAQIDTLPIQRTGLDNLFHTIWPRTYTIVNTIQNKPAPSTDMIADVTAEAQKAGLPETQIVNWVNSLPPDLVDAVNRGEFNGNILTRGLLRPDQWTQSLDLDTAEAETRYLAMLSLLEETIRRAQADDIAVGVVLLPTPFQHNPTYGRVWEQSGTQIRQEWLTEPTTLEQRMANWAAEQSIPYLDLTPHFRLTSQDKPDLLLNYPLDGHWTSEGHRVAADEMARWLNSWYFQ